MPEISGTISGSIKSVALQVPCNVKWFSLYDNGSGSTGRIGMVISGHEVYFHAFTLAANASSEQLVDIKLLAGAQIIVVSSNSIDYVFTLSD